MQPIYLHYDFERYYKKQNEMLKLFQMMNPQKGGLLLEMGCGMGELLDMFGRYGLTVHGIDASNAQCEIARLRLCSQNIPAKIYCSSFYDLENLEEKYDIIIFEAAFHHCGKPMKLLEIIRKKLVGNGKLVFLNEPIANFKKPWGVVRNDGETIYQIRKRGWLELGYSMSFLTEALGRIGFVWDKVDESNNIFIATLK
jgi:2-polyprenyl-3-methyl-5-hydroxy-6-metoxy-1,4-benzoquinol methylase